MEFFKESQGGLLFSRRGEQVLIRPWGKNSLRVQASISSTASSATACELTPVEIATGIPLLPASSTSTVSYPTPQRW